MSDILNQEQLDMFFNDARIAGHTCKSIKGKPPKGMCYTDGDPVLNDVNIGWMNVVTGEQVDIVYRDFKEEICKTI